MEWNRANRELPTLVNGPSSNVKCRTVYGHRRCWVVANRLCLYKLGTSHVGAEHEGKSRWPSSLLNRPVVLELWLGRSEEHPEDWVSVTGKFRVGYSFRVRTPTPIYAPPLSAQTISIAFSRAPS